MSLRADLHGAVLLISIALASCAQKDSGPGQTTPAALPDWSGVWAAEGLPFVGVDGFPFMDADPANVETVPPALTVFNAAAPLNTKTRAAVQTLLAETRGDVGRTPNGATGWGFPLMMQSPPPIQFLVTPQETLILNAYRDVRRIYTDGKARPPVEDRWPPTTWGDSVGHWEGDTLVIETIDVREPREYFGLVLPFTSRARYTERLRRTSPDRIEGEMIIEDPDVLEQPMIVSLAYRREDVVSRLVLDSFGVDRTGFDGEFNTIESPEP
jgi:hypothetical protein